MLRERRNEEFIEELENLIEQYKSDVLSMHHFTSKMKKLKHRYTAQEYAIESRQEIARLCEKFCEKGQEEKEKAKEKISNLEEKHDVEMVEQLQTGLTVRFEGEEYRTGHEGMYVTDENGEELDLDKDHPVKQFVKQRFNAWDNAVSNVAEFLREQEEVDMVHTEERGFDIVTNIDRYQLRTLTFYPENLEDIQVKYNHLDNMGSINEILLQEELEEALQNQSLSKQNEEGEASSNE